MNLPSVTYVVPTLNSGKTLDLTLYSLRSQAKISPEILVVDSGSTDNTLEICQRWQVKTLYTEPGNIYRAINTGLRLSQSDWLGYLNSDDWLYPDSVSRLVTHGEENNADFVYGKCDYTDYGGRFIFSSTPAFPDELLPLFKRRLFGLDQQACLFRRSLYEQLNGFDEQYTLVGDADFVLRSLQKGAKFAILPQASVACFRQHPQQLGKRNLTLNHQEREKVRKNLGKPTLKDVLTVFNWRFRNIPQYFIRLLRPSLLSDRLQITGLDYQSLKEE